MKVEEINAYNWLIRNWNTFLIDNELSQDILFDALKERFAIHDVDATALIESLYIRLNITHPDITLMY